MVRACCDERWDRVASLMAAIYNCAMGSKGRFTPNDFHPSGRRQKVRLTRKESIEFLGRYGMN